MAPGTVCGMPLTVSGESAELLQAQGEVIARHQGASGPISVEAMRGNLRTGRWQRLQRGVYATFTGRPSRDAELWAALLRAGPGATLSHHTAAERHGLLDGPSAVITITVPADRHPAQHKVPGIVIHRSGSIDRRRHPAMRPPCTRVEDTVLDLIEVAPDFAAAYNWICRAVGRRRTTPERLRQAMAVRKKMRWRRDLELALGDADAGVLSVLEHRYVRGVERPHGLPAARRQARVQRPTGSWYLDSFYDDFGVCVELDGAAAHPADEHWRDKRRDNWNLVHEGIVTLRLGFLDLRDRRCETARDVAIRLRKSGWRATPRPCPSPACVLHDRGQFLADSAQNWPRS